MLLACLLGLLGLLVSFALPILLLQLPMGQAPWPVRLEVPRLLGVLTLGVLGTNVLVPVAALGLGLVLGAPVLVVLCLRLVLPGVPGSLVVLPGVNVLAEATLCLLLRAGDVPGAVDGLRRVHPLHLLGLGLEDAVLLCLGLVLGALGQVLLPVGVVCGQVHP